MLLRCLDDHVSNVIMIYPVFGAILKKAIRIKIKNKTKVLKYLIRKVFASCLFHSKRCNVIPYSITFIKLGKNRYIHNLFLNILESSYYIYCFLK